MSKLDRIAATGLALTVAGLLIIAAASIAAVVLMVTGNVQPATEPDYTIAPCELWATDKAPVLPPHTIENACTYIDQNGLVQISIAPSK